MGDDSSVDERTSLLRNSESFSKAPSFPPVIENSNGLTFYGTPDASSYICNERYPELPNQTLTSDSSSLATLAVNKKISDPRRTFCLFVLFDLLITILLWLIEVGTSCGNDKSFFIVLKHQITEFQLHTSLFDVVMLALGRFIFLVVAYALFRVRHWWPVAVSTAVCDIGLVFKIFGVFAELPFQNDTAQTLDVPMTIVLLLTNFLLTWIEVWFVDFKVLPAEMKLAHKTVQAFIHQSYQSGGVDDPMFSRHPLYATRARSEYSRFYSPAASPTGSESGRTGIESMYYSMHGYHRSASQFSAMDLKLIEQGKRGLNKLWEMYQDTSIWTLEKTTGNGDVVYSTQTEEYGKSFKIEATIPETPPDKIFHNIILKPEDMPTWNKAVCDVQILRRIGDQTFVTLEVSTPAALGLIASREFVTVRRVDRRGDMYISAGSSTDQCEELVPKSNYIRGCNGPTGFIITPGESGSSNFVWILNTDLRGNLSRSLVNSNLTRTMIEFVSAMKTRLYSM